MGGTHGLRHADRLRAQATCSWAAAPRAFARTADAGTIPIATPRASAPEKGSWNLGRALAPRAVIGRGHVGETETGTELESPRH